MTPAVAELAVPHQQRRRENSPAASAENLSTNCTYWVLRNNSPPSVNCTRNTVERRDEEGAPLHDRRIEQRARPPPFTRPARCWTGQSTTGPPATDVGRRGCAHPPREGTQRPPRRSGSLRRLSIERRSAGCRFGKPDDVVNDQGQGESIREGPPTVKGGVPAEGHQRRTAHERSGARPRIAWVPPMIPTAVR